MSAPESAPPKPAVLGPFGPLSTSGLWHLLNAPRHVDGTSVRVASIALIIFYGVSSVVRQAPGHPEVWYLRAIIFLYAGAGVLLGPRFTWNVLRTYTLGVALLLPSVTAAITMVRGYAPGDLAVTALSAFAPLVFLQTAVDVLVAVIVLAVAAVAVLGGAPLAGLPADAVGVVVAGALATGAITALVLIAFRGRIGESTAWWQEACGRERALREFSELTAPHLGDEVLGREFARRLHGVFGPGLCAVVLSGAGAVPRVVASAGPTVAAGTVRPAQLMRLMTLVADRQPVLRSRLTAEVLSDEMADLPWCAIGGTVVVLPVVIDDRVDGVVVLSSPTARQIAREDLLLWRAMAAQIGSAVGSARLFARLQEALRARSEFVNTMSHELRSPLHVIIGYADMLNESRDNAGFLAGRIRASALELLHLVENTLAVARLGAGKVRLEPSEFDLYELADELRESVAALPEAQHGVAVRWQLSDDLPAVRLDRLKLKEVVHNLVSNALKFTERGAVTVRVGCEGERLRIDVEDTGAGVPPAAQERIFDMFERLDSASGPRATGVGLGLYIVKSLVQLMQGTVTLASDLGSGSRFTVVLPLQLHRTTGDWRRAAGAGGALTPTLSRR
jgi:signal transduction histidine kinase